MNWLARILLVLALALPPLSAEAWRARNGHEVFPVSEGVFEVIGRVGSGAADYWCAAGDFARRVADTSATQRIYVWREIGPSLTRPGRKAVQFSFSAPPGADLKPGLSLSVRVVGENLNSTAAHQYCYGDDPFDPFPRRGW